MPIYKLCLVPSLCLSPPFGPLSWKNISVRIHTAQTAEWPSGQSVFEIPFCRQKQAAAALLIPNALGMATIQTLPIESIEHVFLFLESPKDLLHVALTCKEFYQMIDATHRLHFHSVSCSPSETDSAFWRKLSTSQRSSSMFRYLELCDNSRFQQLSSIRRQPIFRIDENFVTKWTDENHELLPEPETARSNFETFLAYLDKFTGCQSITILGRFSKEEYSDIFAYISNTLSVHLDTFIVKNLTRFVLSNGYVPRYTLSVRLVLSTINIAKACFA